MNITLITLIPKVDHASKLFQFRPISLCNVSYKLCTKILVSRLREVMERVVSPSQGSFVPNRQSRDNIIITQETIHSMKMKKGEKG